MIWLVIMLCSLVALGFALAMGVFAYMVVRTIKDVSTHDRLTDEFMQIVLDDSKPLRRTDNNNDNKGNS